MVAFGDADDDYEHEAWNAADEVLRGRLAPALTPDGSGLWRRAISIVPNSARLQITTRPTVQTPTAVSPNAAFNCTPIRATGEVKLQGAAGDSLAGWQLGFIQAEWIETNWADYRGQVDRDGSVFLQRARPPARPAQACRDTVGPVSDIWYNTGVVGTAAAGTPFPARLTSTHYDRPAESYPLVINNATTGKVNFLHEVQLEFHFCFVLTLRDPGLVFHHLKCLYWNVHWQARFRPASYAAPAGAWTVTNVAGGHAANVGHVIDGRPTDRRFVGVLTSPQGANCNAVAANASTSPIKREARTWQNFAITR
jgi:hypothetical protein